MDDQATRKIAVLKIVDHRQLKIVDHRQLGFEHGVLCANHLLAGSPERFVVLENRSIDYLGGFEDGLNSKGCFWDGEVYG
jgi:hypothetical protein